jgi:hypothetical protein
MSDGDILPQIRRKESPIIFSLSYGEASTEPYNLNEGAVDLYLAAQVLCPEARATGQNAYCFNLTRQVGAPVHCPHYRFDNSGTGFNVDAMNKMLLCPLNKSDSKSE